MEESSGGMASLSKNVLFILQTSGHHQLFFFANSTFKIK